MSFESDIKAFQAKALLAASKKTSNAVEELFTTAVVESPSPAGQGEYSKGLLANQWYSMVVGTSTQLSSATNPSGADSLSRIKATLASLPFYGKDSVVTLTNNEPYAYRADQIGWPQGEGTNGWHWSGRVGGYHMTQKAVQKVKGIYS